MNTPFELRTTDGQIVKADRVDTYDYPDSVEPPYVEKVNLGAFPKCPHTDLKLISSTEVRCSCGVGWTGPNVYQLIEQPK